MPCFSSLQRLYREKGENMKHNYTLSGELPEMVQAKLNAMNLSEVRDTWHAYTSGSQSVRSISCFSAWGFFSILNWDYTSAVCIFRAVTRNLGRRYVTAVTSCAWMPFLSSPPKHLQRSSAMWASRFHFLLSCHVMSDSITSKTPAFWDPLK